MAFVTVLSYIHDCPYDSQTAFATVLSYMHECSYDSQETQTAQFLEWTCLLLYCNRWSLKDLLKEIFMFRDKF